MPQQTSTKSSRFGLDYMLGLVRIALGSIFLWAFADKLWGLGFTTCANPETGATDYMCGSAWLQGGSPTEGFLSFATDGPFAEFYQGLAGNPFVDWLFMLGLLGIGLALIFGVAMRIATISGALMMLMMWTAVLPPEHHPAVDDHIIYALVLAALYVANDNQKLGLGKWWQQTSFVQKYPILK